MSLFQPRPVDCPRKRTLDRGCTVSPDFFWLALSSSSWFSVLSPPDFAYCRYLKILLVAAACSCNFLCQAWQTLACFWAFVKHACCHTGASRWSGGQLYPSLLFLCSQPHCWCDRMFLPPDCQWCRFGLLALSCTADSLLITSYLFWLAD